MTKSKLSIDIQLSANQVINSDYFYNYVFRGLVLIHFANEDDQSFFLEHYKQLLFHQFFNKLVSYSKRKEIYDFLHFILILSELDSLAEYYIQCSIDALRAQGKTYRESFLALGQQLCADFETGFTTPIGSTKIIQLNRTLHRLTRFCEQKFPISKFNNIIEATHFYRPGYVKTSIALLFTFATIGFVSFYLGQNFYFCLMASLVAAMLWQFSVEINYQSLGEDLYNAYIATVQYYEDEHFITAKQQSQSEPLEKSHAYSQNTSLLFVPHLTTSSPPAPTSPITEKNLKENKERSLKKRLQRKQHNGNQIHLTKKPQNDLLPIQRSIEIEGYTFYCFISKEGSEEVYNYVHVIEKNINKLCKNNQLFNFLRDFPRVVDKNSIHNGFKPAHKNGILQFYRVKCGLRSYRFIVEPISIPGYSNLFVLSGYYNKRRHERGLLADIEKLHLVKHSCPQLFQQLLLDKIKQRAVKETDTTNNSRLHI